MKILQVIPHYVPAHRYGGPQRVAHPLAKALGRAGHEVVVCTTNLEDEHNDLDVPLDQPVDLDGVTVYYESTLLSRYWGFAPRLWQRIVREVAEADVVLVHAHYQYANWIGALLARKAQKPYIVFAHGSLHREGVSHKSRLLKRLYLRILEHRNFHRALFIAFNAPEERTLSLYSHLGKVISNGLDPTEYTQMPPVGYFRERYPQLQGKLCFLFLGRLDIQQKGLDLLIPAFARLTHVCRDIHLVLAGPDEDGGAEHIRRLTRQHGIDEDAITLTGLISGQEKLAALQDADVFVLPSRFEGLSIALLEALYVGLPMLVTDQVGMHQEIQHAGAGLVIPPSVEAIYTGLCRLTETSVRASMRNRGKYLVQQNYTWDTIAQHLLAEIQELI